MRFFLLVLAITLYTSFLRAEETSFKLTFGGNLGNVPFEIKINSWILSPNFLSFVGDKKNSNFTDDKDFKEVLYIKLNFKF